jgi:hypothetical protein
METKQIQEMIEWVSAQGWDTAPALRREWERRQRVKPASPSQWDVMYNLPTAAPLTTDRVGTEWTLSPQMMWAGYSYRLTRGQRKWLREVHGIDGLAQSVTISWVQVWDGTAHPQEFKFVSDRHVDPKSRSTLVVSGVITSPGKFFFESAQFDTELSLADAKAEDDNEVAPRKKKATVKGKSVDELMAELEAQMK